MKDKFRIIALLVVLFMFSSSYAGEKTIVIDIGHGGRDDGFSVDGFSEKDIAFEIALKIVALNKDGNVKIILSREGDYNLSLKDRVAYINSLNPDYVISLHINSNEDIEVNGFDFFISRDLNNKSYEFAEKIENSINQEFKSNGIVRANFYILQNVESPITLIEMGYLSNPKDWKLLTSVEGQEKIAQNIYAILK